MATKTLSENISQAISDFNGIKQAIIDKGVDVPRGTPTSKYGDKIGEIQSGVSNEEFIKTVDGSATNITLPSELTKIGNYAFYNFTGLTEITFKSTPTTIGSSAFSGCTDLTTIRVPWAEGEVSGSPWGASSANIVYGYTE